MSDQLQLTLIIYMEINFKEIDQTGWVSFDLGEGAYYYGQVSYQDAQGNITQQANDKPIKNGLGIYIYKSQEDQLTRYEGSWSNDLKNGNGKMFYEDGSVYVGNWKNGLKSDNGSMKWSNGDSYEGGWKRDLMDGLGKFSHHEGRLLKGTFKCNYFIQGEFLKNPFLNDQESRQFVEKRKNILKIKEKVSKQQLCFFERVKSNEFEALKKVIEKSNNGNRIPLIFPSTDVEENIGLFRQYTQTTKQACQVFDLRKAYVTPKEDREEFMNDVGRRLGEVASQGGLFIINLDDSDCTYLQKFYPNLKQFYSSKAFPAQIWSKAQISKPQVYSKLRPEIPFISPDFNIVVWTKHRIQEGIDNKQVIEKLERRFDSVIPILKVDYIFINK